MISRTYFVKYRTFDADDEDTVNRKCYAILKLWFWEPTASIVAYLRKGHPAGDLIMIDELVRV